MKVTVLDVCIKELKKFPKKIINDVYELVNDLSEGIQLSMPISRKMSSMGKGVFELRLRDASGAYRIIYLVKRGEHIYLVHAFKKKAEKTPKKNIDIATKRIKKVLHEK